MLAVGGAAGADDRDTVPTAGGLSTTMTLGGKGTAREKIAALSAADIRVAATPAEMAQLTKRAYDIMLDCFHRGVWVRAAGDNLVLCPPYIVENTHIDQMVQTLAESIRRHA